MSFSSLAFLIFAAVFFLCWWWARRTNQIRWAYLVVFSFVFYGWWDYRYLALLLSTGMIDFSAALGMTRWPKFRTLFLLLSLTFDLGVLATFKYLDFAIDNVNWGLSAIGLEVTVPLAHLVLPVGISFYTFQSLSYSIDVYRCKLAATRNLLHFFAYLSMFPQLVAGPIMRASDLLPQLCEARTITADQRWDGTRLIVYGFFKKVVVADSLARVVNQAFATQVVDSGAFWWMIAVMFAFQIYCDFSGYSDIACGLGRWMGYNFMVNFDHPYIAASFRDFWQRWHISLSTWFRDYVYFPLGGSRRSAVRADVNMWVTMLVSGLWHGASWAFVIWGGIHALCLQVERRTQWPQLLARWPGGRHLSTLFVFIVVCLAWMVFRVGSLRELSATSQLWQAGRILGCMLNPMSFNLSYVAHLPYPTLFPLVFVIAMSLRHLWFHCRLGDRQWSLSVENSAWGRAMAPIILSLLVTAAVFLRGPANAFIYFQF